VHCGIDSCGVPCPSLAAYVTADCVLSNFMSDALPDSLPELSSSFSNGFEALPTALDETSPPAPVSHPAVNRPTCIWRKHDDDNGGEHETDHRHHEC
jgi:hypothetical protein